MRVLVWLLCTVASASLLAQTARNQWTADDIIHTAYLGSPQFSPDAQALVWTQRRGVEEKDRFVNDIYLTRLDVMEEGMPLTVQLTRQDESDSAPFFSRDGRTIYFTSSREEGKKLWAMSIYGGEPEEVAKFERGFGNAKWQNDSTLLFESNDGKTRYEDELKKKKDNVVVVEDSVYWTRTRLYAYDLKDKTTRRQTRNAYPLSDYAVSHDGEWIIYWLTMSPHYGADAHPKTRYYLRRTSTGEEREILQGLQTPRNFNFTTAGAGCYFTVDRSSDPQWNGAGITEVHYYDLGTHTHRRVDLDWEWASDGQLLVIGSGVLVSLANGPTNQLAYYHPQGTGWTKQVIELGERMGHVDPLQVSAAGQRLLYTYSTSTVLPRYYVADLAVNEGRLSWSNDREVVRLNEKLRKKDVTRAEVMRWRGYNNEEVTGLLYYPTDYQPGRAYPLMLSIHGGPAGVDRDRWGERWSTYPQLLAQRGAFVLKPNYHGSSDHGLAFVESIKQNYYTPELEDITKGIETLIERGMVHRDSLGTMGWSNGAILTTMLTVRYPDMFKVACAGAGDVNWTSDFGTCQFGVSFDQSYFGGAPYDDTNGKPYNEDYLIYSPLFELEKVRTPTIIFHGSEDRAVPRDQGWEYYRALQQAGQTPVRFLWFPDQPHGLLKLTHQQRKMQEELRWIDQYLFGKSDTTNAAFKEDSPLAQLLTRTGLARHRDHYGRLVNGKLVPELAAVAKDSIQLGRLELTNAQYATYDRAYRYAPAQANYPARVSSDQARKYVQWLSKHTGETYRLPTPAEAKSWHRQAHRTAAKENTLNHWAGYELTPDEVSLLRQKVPTDLATLLREVASFPAQAVGEAKVYDLGGNVAEYAADGSTYGYSAADYVDTDDPTTKPAARMIGLRVVKD